jgi:hypothetical protein
MPSLASFSMPDIFRTKDEEFHRIAAIGQGRNGA